MPLLLNCRNLPFPASGEAIFGRNGPLVLELGFGDGGFLQSMAQKHPDWNLLGADLARVSVTRAWKRLRAAKVTNVRLYGGSGRFLLSNLISPGTLHSMYVNFPDPWPKARHAGRRLFQPEFFPLLASRLAMDRMLHFTTDDGRYFEEAHALALASKLFTITRSAPPELALQTKYARKWKALGRPFHYAVMRKCAENPRPCPPTLLHDTGMYHALLSGSFPKPTAFTSYVHPFTGGKVILLQIMRTDDAQKMVFLARTHEEDLVQDVLIEVRPATAKQADLVVNLTSFGQPLATKGPQEAVKAVTHWLTTRGLSVVKTYF